MKALVLHGINDIQLEEVNNPVLAANEVLVKVLHAGICGSDIPRIYKTGAHVHPLIPGHEFSGQVVEVGASVTKAWIGKSVGVFPLIPCCQCAPCRKMQYEMCTNYSYLGSRRDGGFAEYVAVPEWNLLQLPPGVSRMEAAMLEPMAVAVHAMRQIAPLPQETIVVWGLGTIGLLLAMFLAEAGMKNLLLIGNKPFQKECLRKIGISSEYYCDGSMLDPVSWLQERTNGQGVDVFFDCVGKNEIISQGIRAVAPAGRMVFVGNPYSDMKLEKDIYWQILRKQLTIRGTWNSSYTKEETDDWHYVLDRLEKGSIHPAWFISHEFSLEELEQGLHIMRDKSQDYVKIMCNM